MASEMSKMLKRAIDEYTEKMAEEEDKKIQIALDNTMHRIEEKVDEFLDIMSAEYYDGYDPLYYIRTMQLQKKETRPVMPYTEINKVGGISDLSFGVIFDEHRMDHSSYTIKARWYDKKKKKWKDVKKRKTYTVTPGKKGGKKPNEKKIMEFFKDGIHPNAVIEGITDFITPSPLFTSDKEGHIPDLITEWVEGGELQKIFNEELKKMY